MGVLTILNRNIKWRFRNAFTIVITILQPLLWLVLYGAAASRTMGEAGVENYRAFILPGLMVLVSFSACGSSGMMRYIMEREGSFFGLLTAPVGQWAIVLGQLLEAVLCVLLEAGIMVFVSLLCGARITAGPGSVFLLLVLLFLTAFFLAGLSYGLSFLLPDEAAYETVMNAVALPLFFLSGALFPMDSGQGILGVLIRLNPFTYMVAALRQLVLYGKAGAGQLAFVLPLFLMMGVLVLLWDLRLLEKRRFG